MPHETRRHDDPASQDDPTNPAGGIHPDLRQGVERGACAMLLFPDRVCRARPCRRALTCLLADPEGRPRCLGRAPMDARLLHQALCRETLLLFQDIVLASNGPVYPLSRDPAERELLEAAADLLHALLPDSGGLRDRFRRWRRARDAASGPPHAGEDLAQFRDFLRSIGAKRIAPELKSYPAAALAGTDASTAAKAASITSGPAPGRVASAERIWR